MALSDSLQIKSDMSKSAKREQLILFTKLFVLMGLPWVSVCLHALLHGDHSNHEHCNIVIEVILQ